jgi:UDP-N-acetylmuramate--alanine ligase
MQIHQHIAVENGILKDKKKLHFIGIGGSGMFPIVQILHKKGYIISGSDNNESDILKMERAMGINVSLGHKAENVIGADLVVYSAAIFKDNVELVYAQEHGIPTAERSVMLGAISDAYENAICISGTHGKTTTTSMLTSILLDCGHDPSAVIGGKLPRIGGYGLSGEEFCERLLYEHKCAIVPGVAFGKSGEEFARISYAYSVKHINQALERMEAFIKTLK